MFCTFWPRNVLRATTACNFSSLIWPAGSAPAALASVLFDPPEPQIIGKHSVSRLSYLFVHLQFLSSDSFFWLFLWSSSLLSSPLLSPPLLSSPLLSSPLLFSALLLFSSLLFSSLLFSSLLYSSLLFSSLLFSSLLFSSLTLTNIDSSLIVGIFRCIISLFFAVPLYWLLLDSVTAPVTQNHLSKPDAPKCNPSQEISARTS